MLKLHLDLNKSFLISASSAADLLLIKLDVETLSSENSFSERLLSIRLLQLNVIKDNKMKRQVFFIFLIFCDFKYMKITHINKMYFKKINC